MTKWPILLLNTQIPNIFPCNFVFNEQLPTTEVEKYDLMLETSCRSQDLRAGPGAYTLLGDKRKDY